MNADIQLSQLICSRICHDLVGVAGAINAGIELVTEDPTDISAPLGLMATSAEQVTRRLSLFRVAFGFAGGPESPFDTDEIKKLAEEYFADKKLVLVWDNLQFAESQPTQQSICGKLVLIMLILASDCLARGGQARVHVGPLEDGVGIAIEATGVGARFPEDLQMAINSSVTKDQITARNVHAYFARQLAHSVNGSLEFEVGDGVVQLACVLPA